MRSFFSNIIGNENVKARFAKAVLSNTLPHALLFVGALGSGKKTLAKELAAALNCENKQSNLHPLPCHLCNTCRRIDNELFTDIHYVKREDGKMSLGVDVIEKMRNDIILSATESEFKIYIIEEAELLTPQAQNAMLTILEEPPAGVIIILLAKEADKILTTIKSRVQTIRMERFRKDEILRYLLDKSEKANTMLRADKEALDAVISSSNASLGQALLLSDDGRAAEKTKKRREITIALIDSFKQGGDFLSLYTAISSLPKKRAEFKEALEELLCAIRDLILMKHDTNAPLTFFHTHKDAKERAEKMNAKRLFAIYDIIEKALDDNSKNANMDVQTANLAAQIKLI